MRPPSSRRHLINISTRRTMPNASWKNAVMSRAHKERSQPRKRKHLGLLEKHPTLSRDVLALVMERLRIDSTQSKHKTMRPTISHGRSPRRMPLSL